MGILDTVITLGAMGALGYFIIYYVLPKANLPTGTGGIGQPGIAGQVLWDSNVHGKWNNRQKRTVKGKEGNQAPNGKGIYTAASGNPRLHVNGDGTARLEADGGHGRIYVKATNFNAVLSGELRFDTATIDNTSWKLRNRHGESGACHNRFGGVGGHISRSSVGLKIEKCHNTHESGTEKSLPKPINVGQWVGFRFYVANTIDGKGIYQKVEIDYNDGRGFREVISSIFQNPPAYYTDERKFMQESYFWIRINNSKTGSVTYRNVRLTKIAPVAKSAATITRTILVMNPQYNYNYINRNRRRRRLNQSWQY